jgi:hypothetical protein
LRQLPGYRAIVQGHECYQGKKKRRDFHVAGAFRFFRL